MFKKKLHLLAISIFLMNTNFIFAKKSPTKKTAQPKSSQINNDLMEQASVIFTEFQNMTGIDLVKEVGGTIRKNINNNNNEEQYLLNGVSDEELTLFFAPIYMLLSMQQMIKNKFDDANINEIINPINNFAQRQSMMLLNLYIKFKEEGDQKTAQAVLAIALQNLYLTIADINGQKETDLINLQQN